MNYEIGRCYRYPNNRNKFKLVSTNGFIFRFECGHWCTDSVFEDLIDCETGLQVYKDLQIKFF